MRDYRYPEQETRLKPGQSPTAPLADPYVSLTLDALDRRARTATVKIGAGKGIDLPDRLSLHPPAPIGTRRLAAAVRDVIADQCGPRRYGALDDLIARRPPGSTAGRRPTSSAAPIRSKARCGRSWRCRTPCCRSRARPAPARPGPRPAPSSRWSRPAGGSPSPRPATRRSRTCSAPASTRCRTRRPASRSRTSRSPTSSARATPRTRRKARSTPPPRPATAPGRAPTSSAAPPSTSASPNSTAPSTRSSSTRPGRSVSPTSSRWGAPPATSSSSATPGSCRRWCRARTPAPPAAPASTGCSATTPPSRPTAASSCR